VALGLVVRARDLIVLSRPRSRRAILLRRWPLTTVGTCAVVALLLGAVFQDELAALPGALALPLVMPGYALIVVAFLLTGLRGPSTLLVIVPGLIVLDVGVRALLKRLFARRPSVRPPPPPATPS
jgi:hypothetical protein